MNFKWEVTWRPYGEDTKSKMTYPWGKDSGVADLQLYESESESGIWRGEETEISELSTKVDQNIKG